MTYLHKQGYYRKKLFQAKGGGGEGVKGKVQMGGGGTHLVKIVHLQKGN